MVNNCTDDITGQSHGTYRQTADISWWPKPSAWAGSGLNVGYWSRDCEGWFQKRLALLREGKGDLKNPSVWKHSIKFTQACRETDRTNENLSAQILQFLLHPE
jgi:hypothetical protein